MKKCSIEGCERPFRCKGVCGIHYQRLQRHGDPLAGGKTKNRARDGMKTCPTCEINKPVHAFEYVSPRQTHGYCIACVDQQLAPSIVELRQMKRYSLSWDRFTELFERFGGRCWICGLAKATQVDHDHSCCAGRNSCGECVRGFLCFPCNNRLGKMDDSLDRATEAGWHEAATYLLVEEARLKA